MSTSKSAAESAATTSSRTSTIPALGIGPEHQRHHRRVAVLREAGLVAFVGVPRDLHDASALDRGAEVHDEGPELRGVGRELGGVDDHGVVDAVTLGEVLVEDLSAFVESGLVVRLASELNADPRRVPAARIEAASSRPHAVITRHGWTAEARARNWVMELDGLELDGLELDGLELDGLEVAPVAGGKRWAMKCLSIWIPRPGPAEDVSSCQDERGAPWNAKVPAVASTQEG